VIHGGVCFSVDLSRVGDALPVVRCDDFDHQRRVGVPTSAASGRIIQCMAWSGRPLRCLTALQE
jgi:hypothetical protein